MSRFFVLLLAAAMTWVAPRAVQAQSVQVFRGIPEVKISEAGNERTIDSLHRQDAVNFATVISEIGGKYYWASRENKELVRHQAGAFITYLAVDGSGYIRVIEPAFKSTAALLSSTEADFDYVEHLPLGLRSVTYFGRSQP